jgi:pimeloyl-ACP methyl ester carboxylesterase
MQQDADKTTLFVETSAGTIACCERGSGESSVLLLHGSGFSKAVFKPLMSHPALAGYRVVAMDLPGHGQSENARQPALTYRISGFAAVVREVLVARALEGCVMLGWSLGGDIAMEFLAGELAISGLAVVGAPPVSAGILGRLQGYTLTGVSLAAKPKMTMAEAMRFESYCVGRSADGRFVADLQRTDPMMRPQLARSALTGMGSNQRKAILSTTLPLWLVAGAEDPLVRIAYLKRFAADCPERSKPWIVPGAGHAPFLDNTDEFATCFAAFIRRTRERDTQTSRALAGGV